MKRKGLYRKYHRPVGIRIMRIIKDGMTTILGYLSFEVSDFSP